MARLKTGRSLVEPRIRPDAALDTLNATDRDQVIARLERWFAATMIRLLAPLLAMTESATDLFTPARVRALLAPLAANGGFAERHDVDAALATLDAHDRRILREAGLTVGTLDIYDPRLLKPDALRLIAVLSAILRKSLCPMLPPPGTTVTLLTDPIPGYRAFGPKQIRIDLVERVARALHDTRALHHKRKRGAGFVPDPALATSFGIDPATFTAILRACGFRSGPEGHWTWRSRPRARPEPSRPTSPAFAALEGWQG